MSPALWKEITGLFSSCLELSLDEREDLLLKVAASNPELVEQVRALLKTHEHNRDFLESPAFASFSTSEVDGTESSPGRIGPYRLVAELGRGGMGVVYLGVRDDAEFRQEVAVKLIKRGFDTDEIVRRFRQERQILAGLDHPHIARLLDGGSTDDGRPYFVLERVQGQRIDAYCASHNLTLAQRITLFLQVCDAVHCAHQHLVVHRDIKPGNVLVTENGDPKLLDFGVAKLLTVATGTEMTIGAGAGFTPEYASPEQLRGDQPISTATDIYSLGVLLGELLSGARRGSGEGTNPPTPLPTDLRSIVDKALRASKEDRYASAEQFAADLERYLQGQPVLARPQTLAYRTRKFLVRYRWPVTAAASAVLILCGTTGWALWQTRVAQTQRARAERHFAQVRQIAGKLLFQVYDGIQELPGATPVRKKLMDESVHYLDSLAAEADNDPFFQFDLASGYRRLALVQGNDLNANLGSKSEALASLKKAERLQESIVQQTPKCVECRAFLSTLYDDEATISGSREAAEKSVEIRETLSREKPSDQSRRLGLAISLLHASNQADLQNPENAKAQLERALNLFNQLVEAGNPLEGTRNQQSFAEKHMGALLIVHDKDFAAARKHYEKALAIDEALIAEQPASAQRRFNLTFTLSDLAYLDGAEGHPEKAIAGYRRVLDMRENLSAADPNNDQARSAIASTTGYLAGLYFQKHDYNMALQFAIRSLAADGPEVEQDPAHVAPGVAQAWREAGEIYLSWSDQSVGTPDAVQKNRQLASHYLSLALKAYEYQAANKVIGAAEDLKRVKGELEAQPDSRR